MSLLFVLNDSASVEFSTTFSPIERGIERKALRLASGRSLPAHAGKRPAFAALGGYGAAVQSSLWNFHQTLDRQRELTSI